MGCGMLQMLQGCWYGVSIHFWNFEQLPWTLWECLRSKKKGIVVGHAFGEFFWVKVSVDKLKCYFCRLKWWWWYRKKDWFLHSKKFWVMDCLCWVSKLWLPYVRNYMSFKNARYFMLLCINILTFFINSNQRSGRHKARDKLGFKRQLRFDFNFKLVWWKNRERVWNIPMTRDRKNETD